MNSGCSTWWREKPAWMRLEDRVVRPGVAAAGGAAAPRASHISQALAGRVGGEQPVQGGGAGPGQAGDEDRRLDRDLGVLRVRLPGRLAEQPGGQRPAQERPLRLRAERREPRLAGARVEQHREAVGVVVGAEVGQAGPPRRRRVQVVDRADAGCRRSMVVLAAVDVEALAGDRPRQVATPGTPPRPRSRRAPAACPGRSGRRSRRRSPRRSPRASSRGSRSTTSASRPRCARARPSSPGSPAGRARSPGSGPSPAGPPWSACRGPSSAARTAPPSS